MGEVDTIGKKKKRLLKKQKARENIKKLKAAGITDKKIIKQLKNNSVEAEKIARKRLKEKARQERAHARYSYLTKVLNIKPSEASKMRYWSEKRYSEFIRKKEKEIERKKRAAERKTQRENELHLLIFWKEKTDMMLDEQTVENMKHAYKYQSISFLVESIRGFLGSKMPAEIGTTAMTVVPYKQKKDYIRFMRNFNSFKLADMNSWILVYDGKAVRYKPLLIAINAIMRLLYDPEEKADFIGELIQKYLPQVNIKMARRLAKDLNWRGF